MQSAANVLATNEAETRQFPIPANVYAQTVVSVKHYTDRLFSFRITRPQSFRFRSGEFVMIGLPNAEKPVFRAYSIASPAWDDELEFFSIKVPEGPLTQHLQKIQPGDRVVITEGNERGQSIEFIRDGTGTVKWVRVVGRVAVRN